MTYLFENGVGFGSLEREQSVRCLFGYVANERMQAYLCGGALCGEEDGDDAVQQVCVQVFGEVQELVHWGRGLVAAGGVLWVRKGEKGKIFGRRVVVVVLTQSTGGCLVSFRVARPPPKPPSTITTQALLSVMSATALRPFAFRVVDSYAPARFAASREPIYAAVLFVSKIPAAGTPDTTTSETSSSARLSSAILDARFIASLRKHTVQYSPAAPTGRPLRILVCLLMSAAHKPTGVSCIELLQLQQMYRGENKRN